MEPIVNESTADLPDDELTDKEILDRYKMEIQLYDKEYQTWEKRGTKIVKRYKDERAAQQTSPTRFNILYSNVQTLFPAAYGGDPKPDIQRRFKDDDVLGRVTSDVLERCTSYQVNSKFSDTVKHCLQDRLLPGRGVAWARYEPHFRDVTQEYTDGQITDDVEPIQEVYYEEVVHDYVFWKDFFHNVARIWDEVYVGGRRVYLTKQELIERFGKEIAEMCPLDYSHKGLSDEKKNDVMKKSVIYECWDKNKKKVYWLHKDVDQFLDVKDDPLGLPDFFPFPKPLFSTITNDSLVPVPDYAEYQDQAMELDELTSRISQITKAIKVVGVYDASAQGVERMLNEGVENRLIPIESWAVFGEKGGLKAAVEYMPIKELADVLLTLYEAREKVKNDLYEITGIADIIRGATKASETATAQDIKSKFATLRLDTIQHSVARFARDMVISTALIIAEHFSLETIKQISGIKLMTAQEKQQAQMMMQQAQATGQQIPPLSEQQQELMDNPTWEEVYELLRDQPKLNFSIDIETDSTVKQDEQQEKQDRMEFLTAAGTFIQQATQVPNPEMMPLLIEMLLFGVRGFKVGKSIEGTFRTVLRKAEKAAQNPPAPKPDPAMEKVKADAQIEQQRMEADKQEAANDAQIKQQAAQSDADLAEKKFQNETVLQEKKLQMEYEFKNREAEMKLKADGENEDKSRQHELNLQDIEPPEVKEERVKRILEAMASMTQQNQALLQQMAATNENIAQIANGVQAVHQQITKPKKVSMQTRDGRTLTAQVH